MDSVICPSNNQGRPYQSTEFGRSSKLFLRGEVCYTNLIVLSPTFWLINDCCGKRNRSCGQVTVVVKITVSMVESLAHLKAFLAGLGYS